MGGGEWGGLLELVLEVERDEEVLCSLRGDFWFGRDGLRRLVGWLVGWSVGRCVGWFSWLACESFGVLQVSATSQRQLKALIGMARMPLLRGHNMTLARLSHRCPKATPMVGSSDGLGRQMITWSSREAA